MMHKKAKSHTMHGVRGGTQVGSRVRREETEGVKRGRRKEGKREGGTTHLVSPTLEANPAARD